MLDDIFLADDYTSDLFADSFLCVTKNSDKVPCVRRIDDGSVRNSHHKEKIGSLIDDFQQELLRGPVARGRFQCG